MRAIRAKVIEQDTDEGTYVERDTTVTIYVSTGETSPVEVTFSLPLPSGIHGSYSIDIYNNGNVAYTQKIGSGESVAGGSVNVTVKGQEDRNSDYLHHK